MPMHRESDCPDKAMEYSSTLNNIDDTDDFANNVMVEVACDKIIVDICSDVERCDENEVTEKEKIKDPMVGMVFESLEDCYQFYKNYGQQKGFAVMKRNIKRGDDGLVRWVTFACSRTRTTQSSKSSLKSRLTTKTDCPAKINIVLQRDLKFKLTVANLEHNHTLSPGKSRFFRCNKRLDSHVKRRLELNDQAGIILNIIIHKGILCRHSLAVLTSKKVKEVPNKYILSRWRKDINRKYTLIKSSYGDLGAKPRSKSYDKMFNGLMEVAAIAEGDEERCKFVIANTHQIKEQFLSSKSVLGNNQPTAVVTLIGSQNIDNDNVGLSQVSSKIHSPLATRRKGRPPVNRKVSKTEVAVKRKKRNSLKREQKMRNSGSEETLPASSMLNIDHEDGTYGTAVGPPYTSNQSQAHLMHIWRGGHTELLLNLGNPIENPSQESINAFNPNSNPDEDGNG